jgi:hypothetical protein
MKRPEINSKIERTEPDSGYEDQDYTQNVMVKLRQGSLLRIFDPEMLIKKEMIGKEGKMTLTAFLPQIQKISQQKFSVISAISYNNEQKQLPMHFEGRIEEFNDKRDRFILNFGAGLMEVDIHAFQAEGFNVGDFIAFDVYRIDLNVLYPDK